MATAKRKGAAPVKPKAAVAAKAKVAVPTTPEGQRRHLREPVWLVRIVLVLFLVGFASFLAREVVNLGRVLGS